MEQSTTADKWLKWTVAIAILVLIIALYVGLRWRADHISLAQVVDQAIPYETAVSNQRPTLIEFYADWCESCQSMAKDNYALEQQYGERINFVMLNVDNNKWLPELTKYRVDGIPRFIFLDEKQQVLGDAVGIVPKSVLEANLLALMNGQALPYNAVAGGNSSNVTAPQPAPAIDPRSHG
jgi:thiol-disulfide isomerase/thioredoxin